MKDEALQYYMHDGPAAFRFELSGRLNSDGARRLDQDWRTASSVIGDRKLIVDITFLTEADEHGRALLAGWYRDGARLIADSHASRELARLIIGQPLEVSDAPAAAAVPPRTWPIVRSLVTAFLVMAFPMEAISATLKAETAAAWRDYVKAANANHQERVRGGANFLWTFENAERASRVRAGEIVVEPVSAEVPRKVAGGLIHHWIGAVLLPDVTLDEVVALTRDYDHYKNMYHPSVIESKMITRNGSEDTFSMMLINRAFFTKTALDADYETKTVRVGARRAYSVSSTTRVQEIDDFGRNSQHRLPEGEGGGYVWKLHSIARFEQRDGGVYVELEAVALSRDVPAMLRLVVDPIVRRVSRNSLLTSLQQTADAARANSVTVSPAPQRTLATFSFH